MINYLKTQGGVTLYYEHDALPYHHAIEPLLEQLNAHRGALFASSFEYPGRYTCWDIGFYNPPLAVTFKKEGLYLEALNQRGEILLKMIQRGLMHATQLVLNPLSPQKIEVKIRHTQTIFSEEERSLQPSVFTLIRELLTFFKTPDEPYLGLYGAFGYDLILQFEALTLKQPRQKDARDMVLYLPDEIYVVNHRKEEAFIRRYEFEFQELSSKAFPREGASVPYQPHLKPNKVGDHEPGDYAKLVDEAKKQFACGNLFEVVLSQTFYTQCNEEPSAIFTRMRELNPSPYGFFINLGEKEYLIGASPEMYVRVHGKRIETCPISGTIKRGENALEDAENIQKLLDSEKECSELTMCTDVDRNDKSRICEAGSVKILGRRQIEMYSRVIHTVDHIEGTLRDGFDAVDAFLTHMWVVTVTGAPKLWAMNFIEAHEKSPRGWYGGAVGWFGFDGNLNTGLILRTLRIQEGIATMRAGATLLFDSVPEAEEEETRLKASAFLDLLKPCRQSLKPTTFKPISPGKNVLLIDHQDSFVHTLANYFRQTGATVKTIRSDYAASYLNAEHFDLVVLSPGPGCPKDFNLSQIIQRVLDKKIPLFGVCLGLQGIVEYFGGTLAVLPYPMHGKASEMVLLSDDPLWEDFDATFIAARYHSLYACRDNLPQALKITATTKEGIIMAVSHQSLPIYAVQFHPEAILTLKKQAGLRLIFNLMKIILK